MEITRKRARELYEILEAEHERIREESDEQPDRIDGVPVTTLWERRRNRVIERLRRLPELVTEAAAELEVVRTRGRKPKLTPAQKTTLFLYARLADRSNRDMESLLALLAPVFNVEVSYKTIERLYSDEEVSIVLHNLFQLLLTEEGVSGQTAGDGTGYSLHAGKHYRDQLGVVLAFSTETNLPLGIEVHWGSMKDITTFREFIDITEPKNVGFIVDRGLFSEDLIQDFADEGIQYVVPLRKNSRFADPRWVHWRSAFKYQERYIRWGKRHHDVGTVYLFEDPEVKGQQEKALLRKEAEGTLTQKQFDKKQKRIGILAILSDMDLPGQEIYELYKGRHEVELAFDAMKNHLDADKTHMETDDALRGYFFVTFLALRIYFAVLKKLRKHELNQKVSVAETFWELRKVERIKKPGDKEAFAQIPKRAQKIVDIFPEALPMALTTRVTVG